MSLPWLLALAGAIAAAACAWLALRARAEASRLRGRIEDASVALQDLQLSFSRFAPDEVIERVISAGLSDHGEKKEVTVLFASISAFAGMFLFNNLPKFPTSMFQCPKRSWRRRCPVG